jgi:hypothetical protein
MRNRAFIIGLTLIYSLFSPLAVFAGGGSGTTGAEFLKIGVGARDIALGGAVVAVTDDAHALYWNPAGATQITDQRIDASYNNLYQDTNQGFFGYSHPTGSGVWSGAVDYLQVGNIEERTSDSATPNYTFTSKDSALIGSYARANVIPHLALGANLKYIQSYLDNASAHAIAADMGALYQVGQTPLTLGASMLNLGTDLKYVNAHEPLPLGFKVGGAYRLLDNKILFGLGYDSWIRDERSFMDLGVEYKPNQWIAIRTGYQIGRGRDQLGSSLVGFSTGIGFEFHQFSLDYAYVPYGDLGNTQRFSIGYRFGDGSAKSSTLSHP